MIVVAQHRNQYYGRSRVQHGPARYGSFGSPPSGRCREENYRAFESKHVIKRGILDSLSPKIRSPLTSLPVNTVKCHSENQTKSRKPATSSMIAIPIKIKVDVGSTKKDSLNDNFSELWAGPAYSNSPPPSSLPMPKFSLRPKRTVSLELPASASDIDLRPIAKSAPASPTREHSPSPGIVLVSTDSATQTLRRILNLEITD
ncbi:PREDICTED: uncharacterized protein LOC109209179 [Nicotiana attenuata]|uniref:Uncharacterized protein n=1 Tax=Nicotiana attenuata TaxID=49451 RepID=A0A314KQQ7_NICAT|nr:PREDICTED: uncharacterized protein LOC109209179 [Nicotiana attenuata]OIT31074.1 hypothetical protein A4A49_12728 [Nicotiana attenuata]